MEYYQQKESVCEDPLETQQRAYFEQSFFGNGSKSLTEDMVCFQQAAIGYLKYMKANHIPKFFSTFDQDFEKYHIKLTKYLVRIHRVICFKINKFGKGIPHDIYKPLNVLIECQLLLNVDTNAYLGQAAGSETVNLSSGVPLVDMVVNIDMFTASFDDTHKITAVIKEMFQNSKPMRKLFHKHGELILTVLIEKYENLRKLKNKSKENAEKLELDNQSVNIGDIIRLYAELGSMSSWFQDICMISRFFIIMHSKRSSFIMLNLDNDAGEVSAVIKQKH